MDCDFRPLPLFPVLFLFFKLASRPTECMSSSIVVPPELNDERRLTAFSSRVVGTSSSFFLFFVVDFFFFVEQQLSRDELLPFLGFLVFLIVFTAILSLFEERDNLESQPDPSLDWTKKSLLVDS